ncbi:MAG: UDP-N-acetylmuramate dehydrogenase [Clostridia bacterium]|nr:UDP-N-acetylmuramate dehydrogenase [Clostridia bacterium]
MNDAFFAHLAEKDVEYKRGLKISALSSVGIGGVASAVLFPDSEEKMIFSLRLLSENNIKHRILGGLTNVLPSDECYDGVLLLTRRMRAAEVDGNAVVAECGMTIPRLCALCAEAGLSGLEALQGIPGTLGGAIYSNAGAFGTEIGELVESVRAYSYNRREQVCLSALDLRFGYRRSILSSERYALTSARLKLKYGSTEKILSDIEEFKARRQSSQPHGMPSLGSIFKRVGDVSAGYYIDRCGLKGYRVGGAAVSHKHAGFIVNVGSATSSDFRDLIDYVKEKVYEKFAVKLIEEIEYI